MTGLRSVRMQKKGKSMSDKKTDVNKKNEIERGIETNYLILDLIVNDYRLGMITENKISGLLSASLKDEKVRYDISSDMNLKSYMESKSFDAEGIRKVIESVSQVLKKCRVYLLEPEDIILEPDNIFMCDVYGELKPKFCYYPGYNRDFAKGLSDLLQIMLGAVDQNDRDAVVLAYSLYQESLKETYVIGDLMRIVNESRKAAEAEVKREVKKEEKPADTVPSEIQFIAEPEKEGYGLGEDDYANMFDEINKTPEPEQVDKKGKKKKLHLF